MVIMMLVALTACGSASAPTPAPAPANNPVKDDLKDYINNYAVTNFVPKNEEIVTYYTEAIQTGDAEVLINAIQEIVVLNAQLYEELVAYTPATAEVQELHNIFVQAVEMRDLAYADVFLALTDSNATEEDGDAAFNKLAEVDAVFAEFSAKMDSMRADLGL